MIGATAYEFQHKNYCLRILRPFLIFSILKNRNIIWFIKNVTIIRFWIHKEN